MLDADRHVAARGENVRQEGILGEPDGVAVVEDRHRQRDHAGIRLHLLVAPHGDVDRDRTVVAAASWKVIVSWLIAHLLAVK